jgi:hypothetical protein
VWESCFSQQEWRTLPDRWGIASSNFVTSGEQPNVIVTIGMTVPEVPSFWSSLALLRFGIVRNSN